MNKPNRAGDTARSIAGAFNALGAGVTAVPEHHPGHAFARVWFAGADRWRRPRGHIAICADGAVLNKITKPEVADLVRSLGVRMKP